MLNDKQYKSVAIIGAGEIGTALEFVLSKKSRALSLWDKDAEKLKKTQVFLR